MEEAFEDMAGEDEEEESEAALQAIIDEVTGQQLAGTSTARTRKLSSSVGFYHVASLLSAGTS